MTDYIEREAAIEAMYELCNKDQRQIFTREQLLALDDVPAADVREVKRGKWSVHEIYKHEMSYGTTAYEPVYKCSACGNLMESYLRYDEPIMPEDADFPRYCPNCGADMREES